MSRIVGVKSFTVSKNFESLKREALLVDKIAVVDIKGTLDILTLQKDDFHKNELEFLLNKGFIFEPNLQKVTNRESKEWLVINKRVEEKIEQHIRYHEICVQLSNENKVNSWLRDYLKNKGQFKFAEYYGNKLSENLIIEEDYLIRHLALILKAQNFNAIPLIQNEHSYEFIENVEKTDIIQITLEAIPTPDDNVPWEQIFDFRADPDSLTKFLALRNWINETARAEISAIECKEKLEFLINQYERHMKLHDMKYHKGVFETILTSTAEIAENIAKLKFSKITQLLFSIKGKKLALMEEEIKAPGNEVAYISKTKGAFG